jgi:hypothetical protein
MEPLHRKEAPPHNASDAYAMAYVVRYIMEYGHYMNKATKVRILELLMYYIEDNTNTESDHMQLKSELIIKSGAGVNIVLDKLPQHLCVDIYNIIYRRMEILNSPLTENTLHSDRGSHCIGFLTMSNHRRWGKTNEF